MPVRLLPLSLPTGLRPRQHQVEMQHLAGLDGDVTLSAFFHTVHWGARDPDHILASRDAVEEEAAGTICCRSRKGPWLISLRGYLHADALLRSAVSA